MFSQNLKGIMQHLPLILSDTDQVADVSLNRVLIFLGFWIIVFSVLGVAYFSPERLQQLQGYWQTGIASWTTLATANVAKKIWGSTSSGVQNPNNQQPSK